MENNDFDSISWANDGESNEASPRLEQRRQDDARPRTPRRSSGKQKAPFPDPQVGNNADPLDLAGVGVEGRLDCTVSSPQKENDGTKDAYVSYLVTTHVSSLSGFPMAEDSDGGLWPFACA